MKRFFYGIMLILLLTCCVGLVGCGNKYGDLVMTSHFAYTEENSQELTSGARRVVTPEGTFDINPDGTYTFYIDDTKSTTSAYLDIIFSNIPNDFTLDADFNISQPNITVNKGYKQYIENGFRTKITANSATNKIVEVRVLSVEGGKEYTIRVRVQQVAKSIEFKNNNLAFSNKQNATVSLEDQIEFTPAVYTKGEGAVSFQFGRKESGGTVTYYRNDSELAAAGFSFNSKTKNLSIITQSTSLDEIVVKATYDNPLGVDPEATTTIKILQEIMDFEIYSGSSKADVTAGNKITTNVQDFIVNFDNLNFADVILKVKSNGLTVNFSYAQNSLFTIDKQPGKSSSFIEYYDENFDVSVITPNNATYTILYYRLIADKGLTTVNALYPSGTYSLQFSCDYADYLVDGYPLRQTYEARCLKLINNFAINGDEMPNISVEDNPSEDDYYLDEKLYLDTDASIIGTEFNVGVARPDTVLPVDAKFVLEFYNIARMKIDSPLDVFSISYKSGTITRNLTRENLSDSNFSFEINTKLYVKLNTASGGSFLPGNTYYIVVRAVKPVSDENIQTVATVRFVVAQGIKSITSFDYNYYEYELDSNGEYVLDGNGVRVVTQNYGQTEFVNFTASAPLNLDIDNNFNTNLSFNCLPVDASLDNLTLVSQNLKIVTVEMAGENSFVLVTKDIGSAIIEVTASNLTDVYYFTVNTYKPINDMSLSLLFTSVEHGVGSYENENGSLKNVTAQNGISTYFNVNVMPAKVTQYTLEYTVTKNADSNPVVIGTITRDAVATGTSAIIQDTNKFKLDCKNNFFLFTSSQHQSDTYLVEIKLRNINGVIKTRSFTASSYVPVEQMSILMPTTTIYQPNTLSFQNKIQTVEDLQIDPSSFAPTNDDRVFGVSARVQSKGGGTPSYTFLNNGKIILYVGGVKDSEYYCSSSGILTRSYSVSKSIATLMNDTQWNGYFWFKLNEDYSYTSVSSIVVNVTIRELNRDLSQDKILNVIKATVSSKILVNYDSVGSNNYEIYFKKGLEQDKEIILELKENTSYNKNLLYMVLNKKTIGTQERFVVPELGFGLADVRLVWTGREAQYKLSISINPTDLLSGYVIILPQDKILSSAQNDIFTNFTYVPVAITESDFEGGMYYIYNNNAYSPAENYESTDTYYLRVKDDISSVIDIWQGAVVFNLIVSDGLSNSYYISTFDEFSKICLSEESSTKNYILTKNIAIPYENFAPLGTNYYQADVTKALADDDYYTLEDGEYTLADRSSGLDLSLKYYRRGFHGTLSGKHIVSDIEGNIISTNYYGITNVNYNIRSSVSSYALIDKLGKSGRIDNLSLSYSSFQPSFDIMLTDFTFGGLVAENYGTIENVKVTYKNVSFSAPLNLTFGGIVGKNYGIITQEMNSISGVRGQVEISILDASLNYKIGGIVGENYGEIYGKYRLNETVNYTFNDAGFDSTLILNVLSSSTVLASSIGGVAGENSGKIGNVSVQGKIFAPNCDNVGGLVGTHIYNADYNGEKTIMQGGVPVTDTIYSLFNAYSIIFINAHDNVGGAVGNLLGESGTKQVYLYNVSAENYSSGNVSRTLVSAHDNVGGLVGHSNFANINYSYVISYFDCNSVTLNVGNNSNYDVVGNNFVAGLIGKMEMTDVNECATNLNLKAQTANASLFVIQNDFESTVRNAFAIGSLYSLGGNTALGFTGMEDGFSYSCVFDVQAQIRVFTCNEATSNSAIIIANFLAGSYGNMWNIDDTQNINSGLPYLQILEAGTGVQQALFASSSISISVVVKDNVNISTDRYVKNNDDSLVIFLNYDEYGKHESGDIKKLNTIDVGDILDITVFPQTSKTSRIFVFTSNESVINIDSEGIMNVVGEGSVKITFSSKLNIEFKKEIYIYVVYGFSNIEVYENVGTTITLDGAHIELAKTATQNLDLSSFYVVQVNENKILDLKSSRNIGVRFIVMEADFEQLVGVANAQTNALNDLFLIGNTYWQYNSSDRYFFVDVASSSSLVISPREAMEQGNSLMVHYYPYISSTFNEAISKILFNEYSGAFTLSIVKGATGIVFGNNISKIEMNQLQVAVIQVTIFTDYSEDEVLTNFEQLEQNNVNFGFTISGYEYYPDKNNVESVTMTFTIWYNDKVNSIDGKINFDLQFYASSNILVTKTMNLVINGFSSVDSVELNVYDKLDNYPQEASKNQFIYNGKEALLAIDVYPYFAKYSTIEISYETDSGSSMFITQKSYDSSASSGSKWDTYENSGMIIQPDGSLLVQKTSGQDTFKSNIGNKYSYSKSYFFSIIVGSDTRNNSLFIVTVKIKNDSGNAISTKTFSIISLAQPVISISTDENILGADGKYYLPYNTENEIIVALTNFSGQITWGLTSQTGYVLRENVRELLTPTKRNGKYYIQTLRYTGDSDNVYDPYIIGNEFVLTAYVDDGQNVYTSTLNFIITLFSVTNLKVRDITDGVMTLQTSTTTPLRAEISAKYDSSVTTTDNWYSTWYSLHGDDIGDELYQKITLAGYSVEEKFYTYITYLQENVAKAKFNTTTSNTSGVFSYVNDSGIKSNLTINTNYNDNIFYVENYKEFFAVVGLRVNRRSTMRYDAKISYNDGGNASIGIPNVSGYTSEASPTFKHIQQFSGDFEMIFEFKTELINYIPVSTVEEFLNMTSGYNYRLINDLELSNYTPIPSNFASFDGNNHIIYITSFSYSSSTQQECKLALFSSVAVDSIVMNTTVRYTSKVENVAGVLVPSVNILQIYFNMTRSIIFGGLTCENNGVLTNCTVTGGVSIRLNVDQSGESVSVDTEINGGLATKNSSTGYITNSKVENFTLICYGQTGGFVCENNGKIVASYFNNSVISDLSSENIGGFVYKNTGEIYECYSQGLRKITDRDIRNTDDGIASFGGDIGGFVYQNDGKISDSYSNIKVSSSSSMAGFFYVDSSSSVISRCYSISYKNPNDNKTTAFPFAGPISTSFEPRIEVKGILNNCFYLLSTESWEETDFFIKDSTDSRQTPANKKATALSFDNFAMHTSFTNYDLSLIYTTAEYEDSTQSSPHTFNYAGGYTWVIIEGKPVIVSTLTNTVSMFEYIGKIKNYSLVYNYFDLTSQAIITGQTEQLSSGKSKTTYFFINPLTATTSEIYSIYIDNNLKTKTYVFAKRGNLEQLTVYYDISSGADQATLISAEVGDVNTRILDVETQNGESVTNDINYRASDTIIIDYNELGDIISITYKVLENASYSYSDRTSGVSDVQGTRTNPYLIYDFNTYNSLLSKNTAQKFFRIVKDIDLKSSFVSTVHSSFQGVLVGNYMSIKNISLSYLSNQIVEGFDSNSFGLFASITTVADKDLNSGETFDTVISNLNLTIDQVLSNAHKFVGALAGRIGPSIYTQTNELTGETTTVESQNLNQKIFLNNINISSNSSSLASIQGKNAVGALSGIATGRVIVKDITCDASVNATFEISNTMTEQMLYTSDKSVEYISYAGGVVGIFDVANVIDPSTQRNYNATNIKIIGANSFIGTVVGSCFGLVGKDAVVNYANTIVMHAETAFIKAVGYAGGIVGENRGLIISSSIKYDEEDETTTTVGYSKYTEFNFFYNSSRYITVAVGGLVGLNNGGTLSNSISSINVRNKRAHIAGGAVGRMIEGTLENVVAGGSVVAKTIMGGLIGTINDATTIVEEGGYNTNAIMKVQYLTSQITKQTYEQFVDSGETEINPKVTIINNCVSATNWLYSDYDYYQSVLRTVGNVGGFIGLVSALIPGTDVENKMNEFVSFVGKNFYSNTLYKANTSVTPDKYIVPTVLSKTLDTYNVFTPVDPVTLRDANGNQCVYPYATTAFYNEVNLSSTNYTVKAEDNILAGQSSEGDQYMNRIYTIMSSTPASLKYDEQFYQPIDSRWTKIIAERTFDWYIRHFGVIYVKDTSGATIYTSVKTEEEYDAILNINANEMFYYISTPVIKNFSYSETFSTFANDIKIFGTPATGQKGFDGYSFDTLADFKAQTTISINGLTILLSNTTLQPVDPDDEIEGTFTEITYTYDGINLSLPDGREISSLSILIKFYMTDTVKWFYVDSVTLNYLCENVSSSVSPSFGDFINLTATSLSPTPATNYTLNVFTKRVIYRAYENGYWSFDKNFLSKNFNVLARFPNNEELADIYVWSSFITPFIDGNETITQIDSAEDLSAFAYSVNVLGHDYNGVEVTLLKDIDLSGKYWVPIGTDATPFRGTFKGLNVSNPPSIKYASVNEKSLYSSENLFPTNLPEYAGLFGKIESATLQNFVVIGGEFFGKYSGGIAGVAIDSKFTNVENRNGVNGTNVAGGIVGVNYSIFGGEESQFINCRNYGEIKLISGGTVDEFVFSGIVGKMNILTEEEITAGVALKITTFENNQNFGNILVTNRDTNYTSNNQKLVSIYVGGLIAQSSFTSFIGENRNFGTINITTNAHKLAVAGGVGFLESDTSTEVLVANIKNDSAIIVSYENSCRDASFTDAYCYVAGAVGYTSKALTLSYGAGRIDFNCRRSTLSQIAISGVVAVATGDISECYNVSNIKLASSDSFTTISLGGVAGIMSLGANTFVSNCYNAGTITADNTSNLFLGGIIGRATSPSEINLLNISNCLNIGKVSVQMINEIKNALGAIIGCDNFVYKGLLNESDDTQSVYMRNYYLRGSAYSANTIYLATTTYEITTNSYKPAEDIVTFADSQISQDLKDTTASFTDWDFTNTWTQAYDTWYPTLINNDAQTLWIDKSSEILSASNIYMIESAEQLAYVAKQINSGAITTKNVTFKLKKQIDLSGKYWTPIGTKEQPFSGTFDGDGFVIKNLTLNGTVLQDDTYGGLFGYVLGATITNFGLEGIIICNVDYAGAVAYSVENSKISKVFTEKGNSTESRIEGKRGAGGLVYKLYGTQDKANSVTTLSFAYNNTNVQGVRGVLAPTTQIVGGIVASISNSTIANCYNGENAVVIRNEAVSGVDDGILVIGEADTNTLLTNVFNLSPTVEDSANSYSCLPRLFKLNISGDVATISADGSKEPLYENLQAGNYELSDVWTKEYSLHEEAFQIYPSLRGLGQNWKNTESDALLSYASTARTEILEDLKQMNANTLVSFAGDNTTTAIRTIYLISTPEELAWLATNVNNGLFSTLNCEFMLTRDIDLGGKYWTPIGNSSLNSFRGIFNFNGHVITGLRIDTTSVLYAGLFGYTQNAQIINGYIHGAFIKVQNENSKAYVGTLIAFAENTIIKNVSVSTNIVAISKAGTYVGGVVGLYTGTAGYQIKNVHVYRTGLVVDLGSYSTMVAEEINGSLGAIKADTIDILAVCTSGNVYVGGVVGYCSGYQTSSTIVSTPDGSDIVEYADNVVNIAGVSTSNSSNVYGGGIVGYGIMFTINASQNAGNVKTYSSKYDSVGGIVGYAYDSIIRNCYFSDGTIESRQSTGRSTTSQNIWSYVGGIVGWIYGSSLQNNVSIGNTRANTQNLDMSAGAIIGRAEYKVFNLDGVDLENLYGSSATGFTTSIGHFDSTCVIEDDLETIFLTDMSLLEDDENEIFIPKYWNNQDKTLKEKRMFLMSCGEIALKAFKPIDNPLVNSQNPGLFISSFDENTVYYASDVPYREGDKMGIALVKLIGDKLSYDYYEVDLIASAETDGYDLSEFINVSSGVDVITCFITIIRAPN